MPDAAQILLIAGVLLVAEERERKLVGAEEATIRRRKDMEREHAARMAEAEAAVRRLQQKLEIFESYKLGFGAEEVTIGRHKDMEREHAACMAEAEAALQRLQCLCFFVYV
eukprot:scaffold307494_cov19-Tisochrysis_lutea.AAC.1